jgi:dTDP-4-dehydrorhamnose 3,5-epimerase
MPDTLEVPIRGVVLVRLSSHDDERGSLSETWRREWFPGSPEMLQANLSRSRAGVLRGLHVHAEQADYWCVVSGTAFVGLFDLRSGSPTEGAKAEIRIEADAQRMGLYIPPGVAHGFYAETEVLLQYLVDRVFTGEDELGLAWDDLAVGIAWPTSRPELSERDRSNPALAEARRFAFPG